MRVVVTFKGPCDSERRNVGLTEIPNGFDGRSIVVTTIYSENYFRSVHGASNNIAYKYFLFSRLDYINIFRGIFHGIYISVTSENYDGGRFEMGRRYVLL